MYLQFFEIKMFLGSVWYQSSAEHFYLFLLISKKCYFLFVHTCDMFEVINAIFNRSNIWQKLKTWVMLIIEPWHDKINQLGVSTADTQTRLGIRPV